MLLPEPTNRCHISISSRIIPNNYVHKQHFSMKRFGEGLSTVITDRLHDARNVMMSCRPGVRIGTCEKLIEHGRQKLHPSKVRSLSMKKIPNQHHHRVNTLIFINEALGLLVYQTSF